MRYRCNYYTPGNRGLDRVGDPETAIEVLVNATTPAEITEWVKKVVWGRE